jgi:hypothetical protein
LLALLALPGVFVAVLVAVLVGVGELRTNVGGIGAGGCVAMV